MINCYDTENPLIIKAPNSRIKLSIEKSKFHRWGVGSKVMVWITR
jgi:hypothetical protein